MGVNVFNFVPDDGIQVDLFDNNIQRHKLRKAVNGIRDKFGKEIIQKATELHEIEIMRNAIEFGSVKHLY